jgi:hypothetical protein
MENGRGEILIGSLSINGLMNSYREERFLGDKEDD